MTKTSTPTDVSPVAYVMGAAVLADGVGLKKIAQLLNFAFGDRQVESHISLSVGVNDWDDFSVFARGVGPLQLVFPGVTSVENDVIRTDIWLDADDAKQSFEIGAEAKMGGGETGTIRFRITGGLGTADFDLLVAPVDNGSEVNASISLSALTNGDEWLKVEILLVRTLGSSATNELKNIRLEGLRVLASSMDIPGDD